MSYRANMEYEDLQVRLQQWVVKNKERLTPCALLAEEARLGDIYASIINAEFAAIGAQNPALYTISACLNSELTAECVAERFAHISTNIQEEL